MDFLPNQDMLSVFITGSIAFLTQFAILIWRISKAESRIHEKIASVEASHDLDMEKSGKDLLEHKLYISENYLKKETFRTLMNDIDARLIRLEGKIDSLRSIIK